MKSLAFFISLMVLCVMTSAMVSGQTSCGFNIVGTWHLQAPGDSAPLSLLRFSPDGTATTYFHNTSGPDPEWRAGSKSISRYRLISPKTPKTIQFIPIGQGSTPATEYEITQYDDGAFTTALATTGEVELTRWIRVDPQRYFIVFAAGKGTPDVGAAAFAMLIKTDGHQVQTDAFGLYPINKGVGAVEIGTLPEEVRKQFTKEPKDDSFAMLRLEVTAGPYARALKVLKTWERRARENSMPYPYPYLNNAVFIDELALSLNQCAAETIKMYELGWRSLDPINQRRDLPQVPYFNIKKLRNLNDSLHVRDAKFYQQWQALNLPPQR
jgi:hypothetical protein